MLIVTLIDSSFIGIDLSQGRKKSTGIWLDSIIEKLDWPGGNSLLGGNQGNSKME
jgi:hypothetical protein